MHKEQTTITSEFPTVDEVIEVDKQPYSAPQVTVHGKLERLTLQDNYAGTDIPTGA